ncbi:MAG: hypothetical protein NC416_11945, partial [Eubacterium sp.]|nr:hypothetical protein [Eubacterium sp.]
TESESVALPFGDSPSTINDYKGYYVFLQAFLLNFYQNLAKIFSFFFIYGTDRIAFRPSQILKKIFYN